MRGWSTDFQSLEILERERLMDVVRVDLIGTGSMVGYFTGSTVGFQCDAARDYPLTVIEGAWKAGE
jgi:hypothetical protein